jgi:hypothetical protein
MKREEASANFCCYLGQVNGQRWLDRTVAH